MKTYKVHLHPRRWRRRLTLWYYRLLAGRGKEDRLSPVETQLLKYFYNIISQPETQLSHYVNGEFVKVLRCKTEQKEIKFVLKNSGGKVFFYKKEPGDNVLIETYVSAKTALILNRVFDKEFLKTIVKMKEEDMELIRSMFPKD
jgi:hypothetical protein